ncbi:hypothetical protein BGZ65_000867 [Modicella reniformis]|uniref:Peptidase S1 domain-containing protein n=1 Tax=Modicella reniformis TaxID=1440133 RepID=A0A9P6IM08_9FUNG|nr:hypothetical protein BGZ65_000867 [Modicella reniformis]
MRLSFTVLVLSLAASATASSILHKRIIGGTNVREGELPFIAQIVNKRRPCTGFLIGPQTIMTAALCVQDRTHSGVVYGHIKSKEGHSTTVAEFVPHPQFNRAMEDYDIGLIFLSKKVPGPYAKIGSSYPKKKVTAAGFGYIDNAGTSSLFLNKVPLNVASKSACLDHFDTFQSARQFCTSYIPLGHAVCGGDSGGPVYTGSGEKLRVVGIVNHGIGGKLCGAEGAYQYHAFIEPYMPWVRDEIRRFERDGPRTP